MSHLAGWARTLRLSRRRGPQSATENARPEVENITTPDGIALAVPTTTDDALLRRIETARWHNVRYDNLRASLTTRASFIVSVNAIVVAGVALLLTQLQAGSIAGGRIAFAVASLGAAISLFFSALSVRHAMGALVSRLKWRELYGDEPPPSRFYQPSDTLKQFRTYDSFQAALQSESLQNQLQAATVSLWVGIQTHSYRYRFIRKATAKLGISITVFVVSSTLVLLLKAIRQFI